MVLRAQESASQSCAIIPPMRIGITVVAVVLLTATVVLLWPSQADSLTSEEELKRLVDGITAGQVLYLRSATYKRPDPTKIPPDSPFHIPESIRSESWYAQDGDGEIILYTTISRALDGRLVEMSRIEDGQVTTYYLSTGAQIWHPQGPIIGDSVTDFVKFVWPWPIGEWHAQVEARDWQGRNAVAWEWRRITFAGPQYVDRYEYVLDRPILHRFALYEEDEVGERTLISDYRIVEYRLLPVANIPQIQVTPCVEDWEPLREPLRASTCLRLGTPN